MVPLAQRQAQKRYNAKRRVEMRSWWTKYKSHLKCERCDETHPATLDFHHVNATDKRYSMAMITAGMWGIGNVLEELKKCIVICSNCHRKLHFEEGTGVHIQNWRKRADMIGHKIV